VTAAIAINEAAGSLRSASGALRGEATVLNDELAGFLARLRAA